MNKENPIDDSGTFNPERFEGPSEDNFLQRWWKKKKHETRRRAQRTGIKVARVISPRDRSAEDKSPLESGAERDASIVFRKMLKDPGTEVLTSPRLGKCYLRNQKKSRLLVLSKHNLRVFNHVYSQDIPLSEKTSELLEKVFLDEVEKRRQGMEDEYQANVRHSLQSIIIELDEEASARTTQEEFELREKIRWANLKAEVNPDENHFSNEAGLP